MKRKIQLTIHNHLSFINYRFLVLEEHNKNGNICSKQSFEMILLSCLKFKWLKFMSFICPPACQFFFLFQIFIMAYLRKKGRMTDLYLLFLNRISRIQHFSDESVSKDIVENWWKTHFSPSLLLYHVIACLLVHQRHMT